VILICKRCIGSLMYGILLAVSNSYAQTDESETNQDVLDTWQEVSGQAGTISDENGEIEWHGQVTQDVYHVDVESNQPSNTLSGLDEGNFSTTRLQGDLRYNENDGDVSYIQGGFSQTNDEAQQSNYRGQITNIQLGRAGNGYQLAAGDVVADFSKIGSSLGLRGLYANKQMQAFNLAGYAGTIANSWESLFNRSTITGQPARTQYLRDVLGAKLSYAIDGNWSVFGTVQTYSDRESSVTDTLSDFLFSESAATGTAGIGYQDNKTQWSVELGSSKISYDLQGADDTSDNALLIDAAHAWDTISIQAGYHDLGSRYASLAQNILPGVRETYISGQWFMTSNLTYGGDVRNSDSRVSNIFGQKSPLTSGYTVSNWVTYSLPQLPGLTFNLQDTRNWVEIKSLDSKSRTTSTDFTTSYANQYYSSSLTLTNLRERDSTSPSTNSTTDGVQLMLGRQLLLGELLILPKISGGVQVYGGYQQQRIANGTETSGGNQGVNMNIASEKLGQLQLSFTNRDTSQPNGGASLNTKSVYLDWAKVIKNVFSIKAYISNNYFNHGDKSKQVDEKIVGLQGDYQW
jgi:hypothetical protein